SQLRRASVARFDWHGSKTSHLRCLRSLRFGDLEPLRRLEEGRVKGQIGFIGKIADGKIGLPILRHIHFDRLARVRIEQKSNFPRAAFYRERVAILLLDLAQAEVAGLMQAKKTHLISKLEVLEFLVGIRLAVRFESRNDR